MGEENREIIAVPTGGAQEEIIMSDKDIAFVIAEAEKRVEVLKKVLGVAIKRTNARDWVDQNGHPYLTASGAEKIAPLFGVKMNELSDKREEREDDKGKYYLYTFQGKFAWAGGSIEAIGTCSSRDKFFAWNSADKTFKPLSEVDETNIKKAAYSNLFQNGVTRVLGIRNLTWADLEPYGIRQSDAAKVEYKNGHSDFTLISEAQGKRLYAICAEKKVPKDVMTEHLKTKYGISTSKEIKREFYEAICEFAQNYKGD